MTAREGRKPRAPRIHVWKTRGEDYAVVLVHCNGKESDYSAGYNRQDAADKHAVKVKLGLPDRHREIAKIVHEPPPRQKASLARDAAKGVVATLVLLAALFAFAAPARAQEEIKQFRPASAVDVQALRADLEKVRTRADAAPGSFFTDPESMGGSALATLVGMLVLGKVRGRTRSRELAAMRAKIEELERYVRSAGRSPLGEPSSSTEGPHG